MPLTVRKIGLDDYTVHERGQMVGRIRYASERSPGLWLWTCIVTLPGPPLGAAGTFDERPLQGSMGELQGEASARRRDEGI
jgi:hypothetical protein